MLFLFIEFSYSNLNDLLLGDLGLGIRRIPLENQLMVACKNFLEMTPYVDSAGKGLHVFYL